MLYLRPHWLSLVLAGEKTMEIRDRRLGLGKWFLACDSKVHGSVEVVVAVPSRTWSCTTRSLLSTGSSAHNYHTGRPWAFD